MSLAADCGASPPGARQSSALGHADGADSLPVGVLAAVVARSKEKQLVSGEARTERDGHDDTQRIAGSADTPARDRTLTIGDAAGGGQHEPLIGSGGIAGVVHEKER